MNPLTFLPLLLLFLSWTWFIVVEGSSEILVSTTFPPSGCNRVDLKCPSLRTAVNITVSNDIISLLPGNYSGLSNLDICIESDVCTFKNVTLRGLGPPEDIVINGNTTTITRALFVQDKTFSEIYNLTYTGIVNVTTITAGIKDLSDPTEDLFDYVGGSAILVYHNPLYLHDVIFRDNGGSVGAAIRMHGSDVMIQNAQFINNNANTAGGAIFSRASNLTIADSVFTSNNASSLIAQIAAVGGAVYFAGEASHNFSISNSRFVGNIAQRSGGAILVQPSTVKDRGPEYFEVKNSYFEGNVANGGGACLTITSCSAVGGAMFISVGSVSISSSKFVNNAVLSSQSSRPAQGGAIFATNLFGSRLKNAFTSISGCNFTNNYAYGAGGAVYGTGQALKVSNTIFEGNYVTSVNPSFTDAPTYGGAVWCSGAALSSFIENCIFDSNLAVSGWGGAVYATDASVMQILSSSFKGNRAISSYTNSGAGGAIMVSSGVNLTVDGSTFESNSAMPYLKQTPLAYSGSGGALFLQSSAVMVANSRFLINSALTGQFDSGSSGGAISLEDCYPSKIENCIFEQNSAPGFIGKSQYASCGTGGALYIKFSSVDVSSSTFFSNWVSSGGSQNAVGGAVSIYFDYASVSSVSDAGVRISTSVFDNNTAFGQLCNELQAGRGGALGLVGATAPPVELYSVNFTRNIAYSATAASGSFSAGGAIVVTFSSNLTAANCHFTGNAAVLGGGDDISSLASEGGEMNHLYFVNSSFDSDMTNVVKLTVNIFSAKSKQLCEELSQGTSQDIAGSGRRLHPQLGASFLGDWSRDFFVHSESSLKRESSGEWLYLRVFDQDIPVSRSDLEGNESVDGLTSRLSVIVEAIERHFVADTQAKGKDLERLSKLLSELRETSGGFSQGVVNLESETRGLLESVPVDALYSLTSIQPDIIISGGTAHFENPVFKGVYHTFFGDFQAYSSIESTGVDTDPNPYYSCTATMNGNISSTDLIITVLFSKLRVVMPLDYQAMEVKVMNIFNSSLHFANDIIVKNTSFMYSSLVQGITGEVEAALDVSDPLRPSNITFNGLLVTGYPLQILLQKNQQRLRSILIKLASNSSTNATAQSVITFSDCNLVVGGLMSIDSPYRGIFLTSNQDSSSLSDYPNSKVILNNNATITVAAEGRVNVVTSTIVTSDDRERDVIINYGTIALVGTTFTLLNEKGIQVGRSEPLALAGSLTSVLKIVGNVVQHPSGSIDLWLNHSSQNRPVLYLMSNRSLQGAVNVRFFTYDFEYCPDLVLYDTSTPSSFSILVVDEPAPGPDLLAINAPTGLEFSKSTTMRNFSTNPSFIPTPSHLLHENVLTIQNIGCNLIFDYYAGVKSSAGVNSFPCHICLSNSSCDYCNGNSCAVKGQCSAGVQYSYDCCDHDCGPYGSCKGSDGYTSFSCECNNWFYTGNDCRELSVGAIIIILTCCFVVAVLFIVVFLYRRSIVQKAKVLEELREGILRHTESANNEYIQNMQQALILNDVFVKYEEIKIESKIGEGSFGVVYKATFRGAQVAVKQMRSMFFELTEKEIDEFRREAYMMSRLRHPNIVLVMGISLNEQEILPMKSRSKKTSEDPSETGFRARSVSSDKKKQAKPQKTVCIITEYLEQGSLADILYGPTKLPGEIWTYELILTCALQAARGMLYLHSHQPAICHRDLKSSNLVVDDHWVVKVTDFGMSRIVPEKVQDHDKGIDEERESIGRNSFIDPSALEGSGSIMVPPSANNSSSAASKPTTANASSATGLEMTSNLGTTAWCAPEILTSSSRTRYSVKVDVYSFGMVLWELWEKKRPFDEYTSRFDIIDAVRAGKRPAISESCPPTFKALIQRCWQAEPSRRPTMNYIVRYLKDELGRVKRNKASANNSNTTNRLTMSSYFRTSLSAPPFNSNGEPIHSERSSVARKSAAFVGDGNDEVERVSQREDLKASFSDNRKSSHDQSQAVGGPPLTIANPLQLRESKEQDARASLTEAEPSNRSSMTNLPEGRTPLVRAVDRSLSYLTESPSMASPLTANYYKYSGGAWRDRYVMKFSGWNSANPDAGLPPSARPPLGHTTPPSTSPLLSYVPGEGGTQASSTTSTAPKRPSAGSGGVEEMRSSNAEVSDARTGNSAGSARRGAASTPGEMESEQDFSTADEHPMFAMETSDDLSGQPQPNKESVTESLLHSSNRSSHQRRFSARDSPRSPTANSQNQTNP